MTKRLSYAARTGMNTRAAAIAAKAVVEKPVFNEDADGHFIRQWKPEELQRYSNDDIRRALSGFRAVDEEDMLEFVPPSAIKYCVTKGWLHQSGKCGPMLVTRKAAAQLDLPRRVRGQAIKFHDGGLA